MRRLSVGGPKLSRTAMLMLLRFKKLDDDYNKALEQHDPAIESIKVGRRAIALDFAMQARTELELLLNGMSEQDALLCG